MVIVKEVSGHANPALGYHHTRTPSSGELHRCIKQDIGVGLAQ